MPTRVAPSAPAGPLRFLSPEGEPLREPGLEEAALRDLYRHMRRLRAFDQKMMNLQRQGRIGFY
ncbi:MAG: 3-methyl-2-oxobutanoate dehydrogenase, partial [Gemmatimonadota bacterium]